MVKIPQIRSTGGFSPFGNTCLGTATGAFVDNEFLANPALPRPGQEGTAITRPKGCGKGGHKDAAGIRGLEGGHLDIPEGKP